MRIGVDYYPEHWDRALWRQDADLMAQTGVKVVRVGEFAWSRLEPREGEYDFGWLDEIVSLMAARGIDVVLGTPTSCPPLWLYKAHPEIAQQHYTGLREPTGIRGHRCYESPVFRKYAADIVTRLAARYGGCRNVIAWQIDNEVEANYCCCDVCVGRFRDWLKARYGTLDRLNAAFHNDVWSGDYSAWEQVEPPVKNHPMVWYNPALVLDYMRFAAESTGGYVAFQRDLIRSVIPNALVTTNFWFCEHMPDLYALYDGLDFAAYDNYPSTRPNGPSHAFHLDLTRGLKRRNFWIMEQFSGLPGCWMNMQRAPLPGMIKGYALQAMARGADAVLHFRWRSAVGGAEMFWHGLIDHDNVPGRRFREFESLCAAAEKLKPVDGTAVEAKVALLFGMDNAFAFKSQLQTEGMDYFEQLTAWHRALVALGVNVDVIDQNADLTGYRAVFAPTMYVRSERAVAALHAFAEAGGTVLLTCRSGVKDVNNNCVMRPLPADYADMAGARVVEYDSLENDAALVEMDGARWQARRWADVLALEGAEALAVYADQYYAKSPAATVNRYGGGRVYYVGTVLEDAACRRLASRILEEAGVPFWADLPAGVEVCTRTGGGRRFTFLFNNTPEPVEVPFEGRRLKLAPYAVRVPELSDELL